jgi:hypothetical protein
LFLVHTARAVLFTSDTSIGSTDTNYDGEDIIVLGCTVTIDGPHAFSDMLIVGDGLVTHSEITNAGSGGLDLTISNNLVIEAGSAISADGQGFGPGLGVGAGATLTSDFPFGFPDTSGGGGGYGGNGGSSFAGATGGGSYGSLLAVTNAGSGGGAGSGPGGAGGGIVNLTIAGALVVDGQITANGASGLNAASGGGSGGGIWISASLVSGSGLISASGGSGEPSAGGGGGGGRIAIYCATNDSSGTFTAHGGQGAVAGGAGTMDFQTIGGAVNQIVVLDNDGSQGTNTPVAIPSNSSMTISGGTIALLSGTDVTISNLLIGSNSWLTAAPGQGVLQLAVLSNCTLQAGGGIVLDGTGYASGIGPGEGETFASNSITTGGGGGEVGYGGNSAYGAKGGNAGVSLLNYNGTQMGSGGGGGGSGGAGGGGLKLTVTHTLSLGGVISANGAPGVGLGGGGGAGGSISITAGTLSGGGFISANGGSGQLPYGGGGGGGLILLSAAKNQFNGSLSAHGGLGAIAGGAGVTSQQSGPQNVSEVIIDNGGLSGTNTPFAGAESQFDLTIANGAIAAVPGTMSGSLHSLAIGSNSFITVASPEMLSLSVSSNATIQAGGGIVLDGKAPNETEAAKSGGGGNGGNGGAGTSGWGGATSQGSLTDPESFGQAGANGATILTGGAGGGAAHITITGQLLLNGVISANGEPAAGGWGGGGGAGGSLWLTTGKLAGSGLISVNGGAGDGSVGGGGAGGRLAIYPVTNTFAGVLSAHGAPGFVAGGAGTIFISTNGTYTPQIILDNGGWVGTNTPLSDLPVCDLTVANGAAAAIANNSATLRNLLVTSNSFFASGANESYGSIFELTVTSSAVIESGGGIIMDGRGDPAGDGGGTITSNNIITGGGGGATGYGGKSAYGASGGNANGYYTEVGGGGGGSSGGAGGGGVQLNVTGALSLGGVISANGAPGGGAGGGGGGGGYITIMAGTFSGSGLLSANGGAGQGTLGGGGGGGAIQVSATSNQFSGSLSAHGGTGAMAGGAGEISEKFGSSTVWEITIDNAGLSGTNTLFNATSGASSYDLTITNGAVATFEESVNTLRNLTVGSNSFITSASVNEEGFRLTVNSNALIAPTGGILADGQGYSNGSGQGAGQTLSGARGGGGAGYGGFGGMGEGGAHGGATYGQLTEPSGFGSGGAIPTISPLSGIYGGHGGGWIVLTVNGKLSLGGRISANGAAALTEGGGGGSGGSIMLTVGTLTGNGLISANGGSGQLPSGGGGGGGRIAILGASNGFQGVISAYGGPGFAPGGAGTVYLYVKSTQNSVPQIILDNNGTGGAYTSLPSFSDSDLTIRGGAVAAVSTGEAGTVRNLVIAANSSLLQTNPQQLTFSITGNATVMPGGSIILDGAGGNSGPGAGGTYSAGGITAGGGGGHGGYGGMSETGGTGGASFDTLLQPVDLGGPGAPGTGQNATVARGGGALHLSVTGTLDVDGLVSANGSTAVNQGGGGAGGSLWLKAGTISGAGTIRANGAPGSLPNGGGGAGGCIAVDYGTNLFTGALSACGGQGFVGGGAGTVFLSPASGASNQLIIDNGGLSGTNTPLSTSARFALTVSGGAVVVPLPSVSEIVLNSLLLQSNGVITHPAAQGSVYLTVLGNALVQSNAAIDADGKGYNASLPGPGAGTMGTNDDGSGGGYGGTGGAGASGAPGGNTYGSVTEPVSWGSEGGLPTDKADPNLSQGGGAIRLNVGGTLTVNGQISANGMPALFPAAGGGAGGSLLLTAGLLAGNGAISANGGAGQDNLGGGGGGGRIALYCLTNQFAGATSVSGGGGFAAGQAGSLWLSTNVVAPGIVAQLPNATIAYPTNAVSLTFNQPINPASISPASLVITTPNGPVPASDLVVSVTGDTQVNISFPVQRTVGAYSIQAGPPIQNIYGIPMAAPYSGTFSMIAPAVPLSVAAGPLGASLNLQWSGVPGAAYQLQSSTDLVHWQPCNDPIAGSNGMINVAVPVGSDPGTFFRLVPAN